MTWTRLQAIGPPLAFFVLASVLVGIGALTIGEAAWAAVAVAAGFGASGWLAPARWRRRVAEATLLPLGYALTMISDLALRRMVVPVLLVLAVSCAYWATTRSTCQQLHPLLAGFLGIAIWAAPGVPAAGAAAAVLAAVACAILGWAGARAGGAISGGVAILIGSTLTLPSRPALSVILIGAGVLVGWKPRHLPAVARVARAWFPAALAAGCVASALAPWGAIPIRRLFPSAGWPALATISVAGVLTPLLPPTAAGAAWLAVSLGLGPVMPAPPDFPALTLDAGHPSAELPVTAAGTYLLDVALARGAQVPQGRAVATASGGGGSLILRAGVNAAEWAWPRADVRASVLHTLPDHPVWRPAGSGRDALWGVAGRTEVTVPAGIRPRVVRDAALPSNVDVIVAAAGPPGPTPPRDWVLPAWLIAAAVAVGLLQLAAGTWRGGAAVAPWMLLLIGSIAARAPVPALRLLAERHAVDLAMAAFLAAWIPAAIVWLKARRVFLAAVALLAPVALATPHLTPSLWGDEPYHLVMLDSIVRFHTFDVSQHYGPAKPGSPLHSPVLAFLLLPAYVLAGRSGALLCLAVAAAAVAALVLRRARALGLGTQGSGVLALLLLLTCPLATYASQIWVEVVGALVLAASLVLIGTPRRGQTAVPAMAALATAVKTRLGLVAFPLAVAAWWPTRRRKGFPAKALVALAGVIVLGLGTSWLLYGHLLGFRGFSDLIPGSAKQVAVVLGGLIFDPAGGLLFAAPILLGALLGVGTLWRRGGDGERAMLLGGLATVLALLHSPEWYGGGSPPFRYLVPLLPAFALAGSVVLSAPRRVRRTVVALLPPSLLVWWVLVTRPHFSINTGDGGWWFADALARRFAADARHLFPSFLRPCPATVWVPTGVIAVVLPVALLVRRHAGFTRYLARQSVTLWLVAFAGVVVAVTQRFDRVVEIEDPQVRRLGGTVEPPEGTFARWSYPNGWRIANGEGVEIPLNMPVSAKVRLEGWLDGAARQGAALRLAWDGSDGEEQRLSGETPGAVVVRPPANGGRHWLHVLLTCPTGGSAVLDRVVVSR
ncbi:MAG: hypothetical protein ACHQQS_02565 [Thermoanaerobaculales bacterium]